jgi:flagella basal body P-ring formation protein FlgA
MRCSRRPTTWRADARRLLLAAAIAGLAVAPLPAQSGGADVDARVRAAIVAAIQARLGRAAAVAVDLLRVEVQGGRAPCDPEADVQSTKLGARVRFSLHCAGDGGPPRRTRVGYALADVRVSVPHVRAARDVPRHARLSAGDLSVADGELGEDAPIGPLPGLDGLVGLETRRPLRAGELVTTTVVVVPPVVRSGDVVMLRAAIGAVEAFGRAVAVENGRLGEVIRLINPESRRPLKGRVTGPGQVDAVGGFHPRRGEGR